MSTEKEVIDHPMDLRDVVFQTVHGLQTIRRDLDAISQELLSAADESLTHRIFTKTLIDTDCALTLYDKLSELSTAIQVIQHAINDLDSDDK